MNQFSASLKSLMVALISAWGQILLLDYYLTGDDRLLHRLPPDPSCQNSLHSMGQETSLWILPVTKYVYFMYLFRNWRITTTFHPNCETEWVVSPRIPTSVGSLPSKLTQGYWGAWGPLGFSVNLEALTNNHWNT